MLTNNETNYSNDDAPQIQFPCCDKLDCTNVALYCSDCDAALLDQYCPGIKYCERITDACNHCIRTHNECATCPTCDKCGKAFERTEKTTVCSRCGQSLENNVDY